MGYPVSIFFQILTDTVPVLMLIKLYSILLQESVLFMPFYLLDSDPHPTVHADPDTGIL